jgi:hypothetical protein
MSDLVAATVLDDLDVWTDVVLPLVAALLGGVLALVGARWGARRAASYQEDQAGRIARGLRRDEREEDALLALDAALTDLEAAADDLAHRAHTAPGTVSSEEPRKLARHLLTFYGECNRLRQRIHSREARESLSSFDSLTLAHEVEEVQTRRAQSDDLTETRDLAGKLLRDTRELRAMIQDALARLA